jgi:tetratricopeptide (TPR) repeat protein
MGRNWVKNFMGELQMKSSFEEQQFTQNGVFQEKADEPLIVVFDDEPLDRILYGKELNGPTTANVFYPALEHMKKIKKAHAEGDGGRILAEAGELARSGREISTGMCSDLTVILGRVVPNYSNAIFHLDLAGLHPLIDQMWNLALHGQDKSLQKSVGTLAYRWYEHHRYYETARHVLAHLLEVYREEGNLPEEGVMLNNYAFEYFLEGRNQEGAPLFARAAVLFQKMGDLFDHANSRANYWICRVESGDWEDLEKMETEIRSLEEILRGKRGWQERKPLLLLAKIEERRGNIEEAIKLAEQAIESSKGSNTRYPELDRKYSEYLKRKIAV